MSEVFVLDPICDEAVEALAARTRVVVPPQSRETSWIGRAAAVIIRTAVIDADAIAAAVPVLKVIGKHGSGVDSIDVKAAHRHGVTVVSTPEANAVSVVELTLGLALAAARRIPLADAGLRAGIALTPAQRIGTELSGKTIGIVGFGAIGRRVAALFRAAFGGPQIAYDPVVPAEVFAQAGVARADALTELLAAADLVTLHVPLVPATRGLIGTAELAAMRPEAILVNAARGGVVDEAALRDALASGRLAAAASDVFVTEPPPADHPLLALPSFVATPHIGGTTREAMIRMGRDVVAGVLDVLEERIPRYKIG